MTTTIKTMIEQTIAAEEAFTTTPSLHGLMPPELRARLKSVVARMRPARSALMKEEELQERRVALASANQEVRKALATLQDCAEYTFRNKPEVLAQLPLTLGRTAEQTASYLRRFKHAVAELDVRFPWPEEVSKERAQELLQRQGRAREAFIAAVADVRAARETLRSARAEAQALWFQDGLAKWVDVMVKDKAQRVAWGRKVSGKKRSSPVTVGVETGVAAPATTAAQPLRAEVKEAELAPVMSIHSAEVVEPAKAVA